MAELRLSIDGVRGGISLPSFGIAIVSAVKMLEELDRAISGVPGGSLRWFVTDLSVGSLTVQVDSQNKLTGRSYDHAVTDVFLDALKSIENQSGIPSYLSESGMGHARKLVNIIGKDGVEGLSVEALSQFVEITSRATEGIHILTRIRRRAVGSVEGRLETISIHGGRPRFIAYHSRTHKAVTCRIPTEALLAQAKDALGRRIQALGTVYSNVMGEPLRVEVQDIYVLRREDELPTREEVRGSDPNLTGDMTTREFIRSIRGG